MELAEGISKEDLQLFLQETGEQLQLLDEDIVKLEKESNTSNLLQEIFRAAHTIKGSSAIVGHHRMSELAHAMENVLDKMRKGLLTAKPEVIDALLNGLDLLGSLKEELVSNDAKQTDITASVAELAKVASDNGSEPKTKVETAAVQLNIDNEAKDKLEQALATGCNAYNIQGTIKKDSAWPTVRCFQLMQELMPMGQIIVSSPTQKEIEDGQPTYDVRLLFASLKNEKAIKKAVSSVPEIENYQVTLCTKEEIAHSVEKSPVAADAAPVKKEESAANQTIRVDVNRLDTLMEQIGELVINRNRISQIGKMLGEKYREDELIINLGDSLSQIGKIVTILQQDVMTIRMLPIEIVFNTLPRMVRDLARKTGKEINLLIEGQETEVDRSVIEHLRDPLMHLLRNAADHGIESPDKREAIGKPKTGTITVSAFHEQDTIMINIIDDGKGINPSDVKESAIRKGIISADAASTLNEEEAINLIFASGVSTAQKITEVSGRGVGLDVVKTNVEAMGGSVSVESTIGQGTKFILKLPLTLAIIPSLLISVDRTMCAIPLSNIVEAVKMESKQIKTVRGKEVTIFRGDVLPLLRLNTIFGWCSANVSDINHIVVVKSNGRQVGLIVDALIEQQEIVVKSLDEFIGGVAGITGASILGDDKVVLILDVASLVRSVIDNNRRQDKDLQDDDIYTPTQSLS